MERKKERKKTETNKSEVIQTGWFSLTGELKQATVTAERERERKKGRKRERDFPKTTVWSFECLNCAVAPTVDQRQRSGLALSGIKSC